MRQHGSGLWAGELDGLVGRDETLTSLRELLDIGRRSAVVTGIPGSGKTSVLTVVSRARAAEGCLVLPLTCHASDRDLAFGGLVDLLSTAPEAPAVLDLVLPSATRAAPDPLRLRLAVLEWLEHLAEDAPVLLVVDDVQWCDDSTLSVLGFVAHRLAGSDVSFLAAARGDAAPAPLRDHPGIELAPLPEHEAKVLLRQAGVSLDALGLPTVIERAAGNPLALLELGRAAASGERGRAAPSSVEVAFSEQLAQLPPDTRWVLLLAAATDGDLRVLGRAVEPVRLLADLAPAEGDGLVRVAEHAVRFRHPLVRAAAYSGAPAADRRAAHALLAQAYAEDPERVAWHRAEAALVPDEAVAEALDRAADLAWRRGAGAEAARLVVRAAELSPERSRYEARMLHAIFIENGRGSFEWVAEAGTRLSLETSDVTVRVRASHMAAYALAQTDRSEAARAALLEVLTQVIEVDAFWGWSSLTTLAVLTYRCGWDSADVADWCRRLEQLADPDADPVIRAARTWVRAQIDPLGRSPELLEALRDEPVADSHPHDLAATHEMMLGAAAWILHEPQVALARLNRSVELMRRSDSPGEMTQTLIALALVQFATGDYDAVDDAGRLVLDIAEARNQSYAALDGQDLLSRVAAIRGDVDRARDLCDEVLLAVQVGHALALEVSVRVTMSWVRIAEDDPMGAWDEVRWLFHEDGSPRHEHIGYRELGHYVATAVRAGAAGEVERVVALAGERISDPGPFHRLQLARARALLAGEDAEPWHREAITTPQAVQWPFDLANAQLEFGGWLRRRYRQAEARTQLQAALDAFERLGARAWVEMARAELRAAGVATSEPEPTAWSHLTGQERQVVRLAARGMTNPEIAAALYLSRRTVSTHLYNAFPKLGVTSRAQLRDVVPT